MALKEDKKAKLKQGFNNSTAKGGGGYFVATWEAAASRSGDPTPAVWFAEDAVGFDEIKKHYSETLATDTKITGSVVVKEDGGWQLVIDPGSKVKTKSALVQVIRAFAEEYKSDSKLATIVKKQDFKKITESSIKVQRKRRVEPIAPHQELAEPAPIGEDELMGVKDDGLEGSGEGDDSEDVYELPESFTFFLPTRAWVEASKAGKANTSKDASESSYVAVLSTLDGWHHAFKGGVVAWERADAAADSLGIIRGAIATWVSKHKVMKRDRRSVLKGVYELVEQHLADLRGAKIDAAIGLGTEAFKDPSTAAVEMITMEQGLITDLESGELSKEEALVTKARLESIQRHTAQIKLEESSKVKLDGMTTEDKLEVLGNVEQQTGVVVELIESEGVNGESRKALAAAIKAVEAMLRTLANQTYASKKPDPKTVVPGAPIQAKKLTAQMGKLVDAVRAAGGDKEAEVLLSRFQKLASTLVKLEIDHEKNDGDWPTAIMRSDDLATVVVRLACGKTEEDFVATRVDLPAVLGPAGTMDHSIFRAALDFIDKGKVPKSESGITFESTSQAQQVIDGMRDMTIRCATDLMDGMLDAMGSVPARIRSLAQTAFDAALETGKPPNGDQVAAYNAAGNIVVLRWLNPQIVRIRTVKDSEGKVISSRFVGLVQDLIQKVANDTLPKDNGGEFGIWTSAFVTFYEKYNPDFRQTLLTGIDRVDARLA